MKIPVLDIQNKEVESIEVPEKIFNAKWNPDLVIQALNAYLANQRKPWAHTKDRGEVSGGGKKPWRQKHTGRARHGSIRSPLWKGGGVTFGPRKEKDYSQKINKKMKRLALFSALSKKLEDQEIKVLKEMPLQEIKTKKAKEMLSNLVDLRKSLLFVSLPSSEKVELSIRNLPKVFITHPETLNIYDVLRVRNIIFEKDALVSFISKYNK
jgi:large subunit ribosomal protein L4